MTESGQSQAIYLETSNPLDVTEDELWELASTLQPLLPNNPVGVACEDQYGAGVTFFEVLHVWLPDGSFLKDYAYTVLLNALGKWAISRFRKKHGSRRPKSITVHDKTGAVIDEYIIESPDGELKQCKFEFGPPRKRPTPRHRK